MSVTRPWRAVSSECGFRDIIATVAVAIMANGSGSAAFIVSGGFLVFPVSSILRPFTPPFMTVQQMAQILKPINQSGPNSHLDVNSVVFGCILEYGLWSSEVPTPNESTLSDFCFQTQDE